MYEFIVDCTNKCVSNCVNCGTDSEISGVHYIDYNSIEAILNCAKQLSSRIYLGGGCFFCHPQWKELLDVNKRLNADVVIDVPLDSFVLDAIASYSPGEYNYAVSVSLWGIGETHNKLSRSKNYCLFPDYKKLLTNNMRVSFVLTQELILDLDKIVDFINGNPQIMSFYFHRLMPTGRCHHTSLPSIDEIIIFQKQLLSRVNDARKIRFHHTVSEPECRAYRERLFIDFYGDIWLWLGVCTYFAGCKYKVR